MDHKVSKDMISSGMIPSGEKTQSDLGRTQYGSAPSPNSLFDAYKSIYKEENINEMLGDGGTKPAAGKMYRVKSGAEGGSRQVKSTYGKPQEGSFLTRQKEKLEAQRAGTDVQGLKDKKAKESEAAKDRVTRANAPRSGIDPRKGKAPVRQMDARNLSNPKFEDVDLLAAYRAVYEHHKKDADGNTIPHEDEEVNEGKIPAGLQAYLDKKKGKKEDKKEIKEEPITLAALAAGAGKLLAGAGAKAAAAGATKAAAAGATKAAAAGAGKAAAASAGKAAGSTIAKGGLTKTITRAGIKAGGKTGGKIAQSIAKDPMGALDKAADLSYKAQMVGSMIPRPKPRTSSSGGGVSGGTTATVSAGADLFDIVKGQLLDEGMSEEEIRDIMLTLTPDEIMSEMAVNPKIAAMDAKNRADMIARAKAKEVPQNIRDASKRQMKAGTPREDPKNPYTTQDKKDIINYNKDK